MKTCSPCVCVAFMCFQLHPISEPLLSLLNAPCSLDHWTTSNYNCINATRQNKINP